MRYERQEGFAGRAREIAAVGSGIDSQDSEREDAQRRELYALVAVASDAAVDSLLARMDESGPLGLVRDISRSPVMGPEPRPVCAVDIQQAADPYAELHWAFTETGQMLRFPEFGRASHDTDRLPAIMDRIAVIGPAVSLIERESRPYYAERLLQRGFQNAVDYDVLTLEVIATLEKERDPEASAADIAAVARRSIPRIASVAAFGFDEFSAHYFDAAQSTEGRTPYSRLDASKFSLEESSAGRRLALPVRPDEAPLTRAGSRHDIRLGCPAVVRIGEASAIEKLLARMIDVAEVTVWDGADRKKRSEPFVAALE